MDTASKSALKTAILNSLPLDGELSNRFKEQYLVWTKQESSWHGEFQLRPDPRRILAAAHNDLERLGSEFSSLFFKAHPEYARGLVGFAGLNATNLSHDKGYLLKA